MHLHLSLVVGHRHYGDERWTVAVDDAGTGTAELLASAFPTAPVGAGTADLTYRLRPATSGEVTIESPFRAGREVANPADAAWAVLAELTRVRLTDDALSFHLHAAALDVDGAGIVLLGESGAGKSTLTAHLAHAGVAVVTDEQLGVDCERGSINGFSRPIAIDPAAHEMVARLMSSAQPAHGDSPWLVAPAQLDAGSGWVPATTPRLLCVLQRGPGPVEFRSLGHTEIFEELVHNNLDLTRDPERGLGHIAWLAATVPAVALHYDEAAEAVPMLLERLHSAPVTAPVPWSVRSAPATDLDPSNRRRFRQMPGVITVKLGGATVLYQPDTRSLLRLNESAGEVWDSLDGRRVARSARELCENLRDLGLAG